VKRAGTTLVELMIALVVISVFAAAVTALIVSNSKADEANDARREARAVARSALNVLLSEMRSGEPAGVILANDSTLTYRQPFAFGLVCDNTGGIVTIAMLPSADLPSSLGVAGYSGWAYRDSTGTYQYQSNTSLASGNSGTCTASSITPLTSNSGRVVQVPSVVGPSAGTIAMLWRQITYSLRASTAVSGRRGMYRAVGSNSAEELAAPFAEGARFRWYLLDNPKVQDTLPTALGDLSGVQFVLTAQSVNTPRNSSSPAQAPFTTSIFFQNRPN
jgi:prepilin-type N-terminal cleavage/methylation domain-containing protein